MSKVFWADAKTTPKRNMFRKILDLLDRSRISKSIAKGSLVAVKVHFGEVGNTSYVRPIYLRPIVERIRELGGRPFLTDSTTLYSGSRSDAVNHLETAIMHGFSYPTVPCPVIIADGLRGLDGVRVQVDGEILKEASIARAIFDADFLFVVTHFKGHELTGFGGALKNLGMGCATREGKLAQHTSISPRVRPEACKGCMVCYETCPAKAIKMKDGKASIESERCMGCAQCVAFCPNGAISVEFNEASDRFQKKMVEYAKAALSNKKGRVVFMNFLTDVTPHCDCWPGSGPPFCGDIGILCSSDPVAIDMASYDLVNKESATWLKATPGEDKWRLLYPKVDPKIQLLHAERLGLGERCYELVKI
jgi:uncharacterized Fe-S center protein